MFQCFLIETSVQRGLAFRPVRHGCNRSAFEDHLEELRDFAYELKINIKNDLKDDIVVNDYTLSDRIYVAICAFCGTYSGMEL